MSVGMSVEGQEQLLARLAHAHDGIAGLTDVIRDMAQLVAREADSRTPTATGGLANNNRSTATATGWGATNGEPYAGFVHWGTKIMKARPWLLEAARATEDSWMDQLTNHVQQLLDGN
jgi:HK97 gp10 family phage protein